MSLKEDKSQNIEYLEMLEQFTSNMALVIYI